MTDMKELELKAKEIFKMGYIKAINNGSGGIGTTFEKMLNINAGKFEIPDYKDIEIKTRRKYSKSHITLFNAAPDGKYLYETKRLRDKYGYPDKICKEFKVLSANAYNDTLTKVGLFYYFGLKVDYINKKIYLYVYDCKKRLIDKQSYWSFELLEEKLYRKLKKMAIVSAWPNKKNNDYYYKYYQIDFYMLKNFEKFIELIEKRVIRITFKVGVYRIGKRYGQIEDHGTSFEIKEEDIIKLFYKVELQ